MRGVTRGGSPRRGRVCQAPSLPMETRREAQSLRAVGSGLGSESSSDVHAPAALRPGAALPSLFPEPRSLGQGSHPCRNLSWHKHQQESADCHFLFELFCVKTKRFGAGCKIVILSPRARVFPHPNGEHLW